MRAARGRGRQHHVRHCSVGTRQTGADPEEGGVRVFHGSLGLNWQLFLPKGGEDVGVRAQL